MPFVNIHFRYCIETCSQESYARDIRGVLAAHDDKFYCNKKLTTARLSGVLQPPYGIISASGSFSYTGIHRGFVDYYENLSFVEIVRDPLLKALNKHVGQPSYYLEDQIHICVLAVSEISSLCWSRDEGNKDYACVDYYCLTPADGSSSEPLAVVLNGNICENKDDVLGLEKIKPIRKCTMFWPPNKQTEEHFHADTCFFYQPPEPMKPKYRSSG